MIKAKTLNSNQYTGNSVITSISITATDGSHVQCAITGIGDGALTEAAAT